jgi:CBS domain-containing protein
VTIAADETPGFDTHRRRVLTTLGRAVGGLGAHAMLGGGFGGLFAGLLAAPAQADAGLDVQILQTASSLEALAVATYAAALGSGAMARITVTSARNTIVAFATDTMRRHGEHKKAFQAQTTALDGRAKVQDAPNPKFLAALQATDLSTPDRVVDFAGLLEKVVTDTYLLNLTMLQDARTKAIMGSVMAVDAQHLATLRVVGALLKGGAPQLVAVPFPITDLAKLPAAVVNAAFPDALEKVNGPELVAEPSSGAVP